jgi:hypothetical protein
MSECSLQNIERLFYELEKKYKEEVFVKNTDIESVVFLKKEEKHFVILVGEDKVNAEEILPFRDIINTELRDGSCTRGCPSDNNVIIYSDREARKRFIDRKCSSVKNVYRNTETMDEIVEEFIQAENYKKIENEEWVKMAEKISSVVNIEAVGRVKIGSKQTATENFIRFMKYVSDILNIMIQRLDFVLPFVKVKPIDLIKDKERLIAVLGLINHVYIFNDVKKLREDKPCSLAIIHTYRVDLYTQWPLFNLAGYTTERFFDESELVKKLFTSPESLAIYSVLVLSAINPEIAMSVTVSDGDAVKYLTKVMKEKGLLIDTIPEKAFPVVDEKTTIETESEESTNKHGDLSPENIE